MPEKEKSNDQAAKPADCQSCPIAKALGMCDGMRNLLTEIDCGEFLTHVSNARREVLLGVKSLLDGVISMEEEKAEKHKQASTAKKQRKRPTEEKLTKIEIE
jgi:hypothetical protein